MNKIKQRIGDLRCEITAITTQRESLDAMQQLELFGLKERLRELETIQIEMNDGITEVEFEDDYDYCICPNGTTFDIGSNICCSCGKLVRDEDM